MDRQIVYVGAVPLDTDQLLQSRNTMVALGYLAKMTIGDDAIYADGLGCSPGSGLSVVIAPGSMSLPTIIDGSSYGSLPPDGDPLVKLGINTAPTTLPLPAGGESVISAIVVEAQSGSSAISYYNAATPSQTLVGEQGNGQAQETVVQQRIVLAATSLSAVPSGYVPLWQVNVPSVATQVTSGMITAAPGAPFLPVKLPKAAPILSPSFIGNPIAPTPAAGDASASLATTSFVAAANIRNRAAWGTGGSYSWTCPAGVATILIRAWAAGGNGGAAASGTPGGGGGGGGYEEVLIGVAPGTSYAIQIGSASDGTSATSFSSIVVIGGGGNGRAGSGSQPGLGGTPGSPIINNLSSITDIGVGAGQAGFQLGGTNVGGAGGPSFGVQGGQPCFGSTVGATGLWPGGGGGGGAMGPGGPGADGLMIIEWTG